MQTDVTLGNGFHADNDDFTNGWNVQLCGKVVEAIMTCFERAQLRVLYIRQLNKEGGAKR